MNDDMVSVVTRVGYRVLWQLRWSELDEIAAWKEDLFAVDLIVFGFRPRGATGYHCCHEQQAGWDDLLVFLERRFNIRLEDWFDRVASPAFATNYTVLWNAPAHAPR